MRRFRKRRRAPRTKAKLPVEGFTAAQLGAKVGVSARTVRFYAAERLLAAPQFRGRGTRYVRGHLVQLAAIRYLRQTRGLALGAIRAHLGQISTAELEQLAAAALPELAPPQPVPAPPRAAARASSTWYRVTVLPGLELQLDETASPEVRETAVELVTLARQKCLERMVTKAQATVGVAAPSSVAAPLQSAAPG